MALSQIQCLDDNHVNPRRHESKPEFLYCEDQRLALETFLRDGREAFVKYLEARGLRGFLSDPELETLAKAVKPYDPGTELFPEDAEDDEPPLSLHYWPDLSDMSIPQIDLGWPDSVSYRGVTRTTVYAQPPLEGQAHIKEVVRKMIAQAQKVIAVVMDVFTDVDIFRDLLDAGVKRKVSVYILLERTALPHFLSMCQRANMHAGHLKNLRVRCSDGGEFHTRSCTKVTGRMGHRFMFIDGDKAVSGSYSFTWMSSRLDTNLITVVTGQAVEAFDRLFRILYATSSFADLRKVALEPEPELEAIPQPVSVAPLSADVARKLNSPKYALVTLANPSPTPSAGPEETQNLKNSNNPETKKGRRSRVNKEAIQETPSIHPGLTNLEKACLMSYLPTWPEPDPPSDVIGFINIRDARKPNQVHLQRSEMFETSQAIRFSSPFSMPKETLPEVAKPRQLTAKYEEINKLQLAQDRIKAEESLTPTVNPNMSYSSTSATCSPFVSTTPLSENNHVSITTSTSLISCSSLSSHSSSSSIPPCTSSLTTLNPPPSSSPPSPCLNSTPPIPKPRTLQLVIKGGVMGNGQKLPEFDVVRRPEASIGARAVHSEPDVANVARTSPEKVPETTNSRSETGAQKDAENTEKVLRQKQSGTFQETKNEVVGQHDDIARLQFVAGNNLEKQSDVFIADAPKTENGYLPLMPTPDPGTHTPDLRPYTPDFQTPTPDEYFSPTADSWSTTSEDSYYECNDSPIHEAVSERAASINHGRTEEHVGFTHKNTPNDTTITTSPAHVNSNTRTATSGTTGRNTSSSDTQSLSRPTRVSSSSSLLEKKVKMVEEKETTKEEEIGREEDEKGRKLIVAERRTEGDNQGTERRDSEEAKRTTDHFKQGKDSTETVEKNEDAQHRALTRKTVQNHSAAGRAVDGEMTPGELTNERTNLKQLPTGQALQPKKASSEEKRADKEKAVDMAPLGPSSVERRDRPQTTTETDGQKLLHTFPKTPQGPQQDSGGSSPSRPSRPPRPLSATQPRPWGSRPLNQAGSKALHSSFQVLDNTSSPRKPPSAPPPLVTVRAVGSAAARKQAEAPHGQHSLLSRQPLAAHSGTVGGQSQNQHPYPKSPASFCHTHSNREAQLHPPSHNQTASPQEARWQEEASAPFSFTFSRLYNLKGLKDKMSKLPAQSKRGRASSPGQGRKSSS
ncbi:hypothetical protein FQN60_003607 [Etheostoma spectabile]|uniref:Scaffolding anchor of CK1 domain-containing protein n=1 Tax=Etheostoma spectabile TaxID=54343 RepID=A0A5J5CVP3_9PERO|nr:hypothetical protein FQN60_003607 [Etheostoma spectabile]